jgi:hypothetical protein
LNRAKKYLAEADYSMSHHILESQLDLSNDNKMYFSKDDPYQGGKPVPLNQQMMFKFLTTPSRTSVTRTASWVTMLRS